MAKRALLIGINKYQIDGADLRGCVNDVEDLRSALVECYDFKKSDITVLTDGAATKKAMQAGIKALLRESKKGDVAVVHYSGHGSNVPDDNGDESDGRDEILCPTDLDWDDPLRDDWLRTTFDGMKAGVNLTVIMDCCHSGTNTRAFLPPDAPIRQRYLPSPSSLWAVESGRSLPRKVTSEIRRSSRAARKTKDIVKADLPEVLITGCRDTQTSADAFINGRYNGALTFALVDAMRKGKTGLTYKDLHDKAAVVLKARKFEQVPQLEGRTDRFDTPLFSA
jgi:metacaspase-1